MSLSLVLLALVLLTWLPRLDGPLDLRWDGGVYYILGTSLATGKGYKLLNEPGEIDATQYPPLLPSVIAAHQMLLGTTDFVVVGRWLRRTFCIISCLYFLSIFHLLKIYLPIRYAFSGTLFCLLNPQATFLSGLCFPEILFGLFTVLFALALALHGAGKKQTLLLRPLLAAAAYLTRTVGVALLAAWVVESFTRRNYRRMLLTSAFALLPVVGWLGYIKSVESSSSYLHPAYEYQRADYMFYNVSYARNISLKDPFAPEKGYLTLDGFGKRFIRNALRMPAAVGEAVTLRRSSWLLLRSPWPEGRRQELRRVVGRVINLLVVLMAAALGILTFVGAGVLLWRREVFIPLYIGMYTAALCLTPWPQQFLRYLAPLAPFLVLSLLTCLLAARDFAARKHPARLSHKTGDRIVLGLLALLLVQEAGGVLKFILLRNDRIVYQHRGETISSRQLFYNRRSQAFDTGIDWLKQQAEPGQIVASSMPHWVFLRTNLKSVMPPFESDPTREQHLLDTVPIDYLIVDQGVLDTKSYLARMINRFPDRWSLVYRDPEGYVEIYRRVKS